EPSQPAAPKAKKETSSFFSAIKGGGNSKVVDMPSSAVQVVLVKPTRFEDAPSIADHLNARKTVVLNLEAANRETSRRLIDFLSGTAYATRGSIKKVANSTYIITPANVDVLGELIDGDFDTDGMFLG
ncbi:MAG: cell division protein SepF, partial [Clostridia bacterium]|nr:cell division protein SepF [Clostridia bacterium]